jgi:hypothetical protein
MKPLELTLRDNGKKLLVNPGMIIAVGSCLKTDQTVIEMLSADGPFYVMEPLDYIRTLWEDAAG